MKIKLHYHKYYLPVTLLISIVVLSSHDLYLKLETYFLKLDQEATLSLYNGTFESSENLITRDRMLDASIVANGVRSEISPDRWQDQDSTITQLSFRPTDQGTYVAGVSTKARNISLSAEKFNSYLEHDGVLDMLQYRTENDLLNEDALESYQKHVKAIYQVGDQRSDDWATVLDYPIEFMPMSNPYEKYTGDSLVVKLLYKGQPLADQLVFANSIDRHHSHDHSGHDHSHDHGESHSHIDGQKLRTDQQGLITIDLPKDGVYYLRTIYMTTADDSEELTHRSTWATLTFEVTHEHGASLPVLAIIAGVVILLMLLLIFIMRRNK